LKFENAIFVTYLYIAGIYIYSYVVTKTLNSDLRFPMKVKGSRYLYMYV